MSTVGPVAVLLGKTQRALLAIFFARPEKTFYLRQIVRMAGVGQGAVQRELRRWTEAGVLIRTRQGNQVHYQANTELPIFPELKSIAIKTSGVADVLREALSSLAESITVAFVHGSVAAGSEKAGSDVDVVVVGEASFGAVVAALPQAQENLGREVNPSVYSPNEFTKKVRAGHHFLTSILSGPKIFLIGGEHELRQLGA